MRTMNLTNNAYGALMKAANQYLKDNDTHCEIYLLNVLDPDGNPYRYGVNCSVCGTQDVETTRKTATSMTMAADLANTLNHLNITVKYEKSDIITDKDAYIDFWEKAYENMEKGDLLGFMLDEYVSAQYDGKRL